MILQLILAFVVGYLIGSIPPGLIIGKLKGVDPREVGSGRTGGTNVYRAAGPAAGIITALLDLTKGAIAILLVRFILQSALGVDPAAQRDLMALASALTGVGAVLGHNWSLYLGFRGGAGTMTNSGVVALLHWPTFLIGGLLGMASLRLTRMSSVASMVFALAVPLLFTLFAMRGMLPWEYLVYGIGEALLILYSLRPNIQRLLEGNERRIGGASES